MVEKILCKTISKGLSISKAAQQTQNMYQGQIWNWEIVATDIQTYREDIKTQNTGCSKPKNDQFSSFKAMIVCGFLSQAEEVKPIIGLTLSGMTCESRKMLMFRAPQGQLLQDSMSWPGCQNNPNDVNFHLQKSLENPADKI